MSDSFNFTVQRQLTHRVTLEFGYIGRRITHEYQPINLNAVPYMMTLGGQQFKQAYANLVLQYCGGIAGLAGGGCAGASTSGATPVTAQPFFEKALAGHRFCVLHRLHQLHSGSGFQRGKPLRERLHSSRHDCQSLRRCESQRHA